MKKFVFGLIAFLLGTAVSVFNYIDAVLNPCSYNGIGGLQGAFLGRGTLNITIVFVIIMLIGLASVDLKHIKRNSSNLSVRL